MQAQWASLKEYFLHYFLGEWPIFLGGTLTPPPKRAFRKPWLHHQVLVFISDKNLMWISNSRLCRWTLAKVQSVPFQKLLTFGELAWITAREAHLSEPSLLEYLDYPRTRHLGPKLLMVITNFPSFTAVHPTRRVAASPGTADSQPLSDQLRSD